MATAIATRHMGWTADRPPYAEASARLRELAQRVLAGLLVNSALPDSEALRSHIPTVMDPPADTALTSQIETVLTWAHSQHLLIRRPSEVREYLLDHRDMIVPLATACAATSQRFGAVAQLSLEVYRDPEIDDEYLTIYVRQGRYDDNILEVIESTWSEFEGTLVGRCGWILLTTDFGPPM